MTSLTAKNITGQPNAQLSRREREKLQRRNNIVDAAQKRFFERSFDEVSMDEIAADLELSKPALYRYFRNKESLYLAVVLRGMEILRETLKVAMEKGSSGKEKTASYLDAFCFDFTKRHHEYYKLIVAAREQRFMQMYEHNKIDGAKEFGGLAFELLIALVEAVRLGIEDGTLKGDLDATQTAIFLVVSAEASINLPLEYRNILKHRDLREEEYLRSSINRMLKAISTGE